MAEQASEDGGVCWDTTSPELRRHKVAYLDQYLPVPYTHTHTHTHTTRLIVWRQHWHLDKQGGGVESIVLSSIQLPDILKGLEPCVIG